MDVRDGRLYPQEQAEIDAFLRKFCVPVEAEQLTFKQVEQKQVSLHDHRSPAGLLLTEKRNVGRNEACPCGSGKKFKFCCMNV